MIEFLDNLIQEEEEEEKAKIQKKEVIKEEIQDEFLKDIKQN